MKTLSNRNPVQQERPARVLMLITTLTFGGAETQVVRLAAELKSMGCDVVVVCMVAPTAYEKQLLDLGIPVYSLNMARGIPDPRGVLRLREIIRGFQPDLVHAHMVHANILGRIARLFCKIPALVCTAHNLRETSEKGGPTWHKELLYRITDPLADGTTIICQAAYDRYVQVGAVPRRKLELIPNGVDMERYSPSPARRAAARRALDVEGKFVWLAVGRLVEQKDYPNLLRALSILGGDNWVALVAGRGPLADSLAAETESLGLSGKVRWVGVREDMLELYNAADAFVMSSAFEGLSAALLEAAAMGLPSVVTDAGGNRDLVIEGETGFIVPTHDAQRLADAMRTLLSASPEMYSALSLAAREHCSQNYRFEAVTRKWAEFYGRFLSPGVTVGQPVREFNAPEAVGS